MNENQVIYAELAVSGVSAEILINDIPLVKINVEKPQFIGIPVMEYILNGENTVEVVINPGESPTLFRFGQTDLPKVNSKIEVRIAIYNDGDFLGEGLGITLASINWTRTKENEEQKKERFPLSKFESFNTTTNNKWLWSSAQNLELTTETILSLNEFVKNIHSAFNERKADPIIKLSKISFIEFGKAYPAAGLGMASEFKSDLESDLNKSWSIEPFNVNNVAYRVIANGKMIECIGKDWLPLVRTKISGDINTNEDYFPYPMKVAMIDGKFQVVR